MLFDTSNKVLAEKAQRYLESLISKGAKVELKQVRKNRSNFQNRWFHAVVKEVSDYTGYELDETKELLKRKGGLNYTKNGHQFTKSTSRLDVKEFSEFMERIIRVCAQELDLSLPDPELYK